jgi:hypothetical protein
MATAGPRLHVHVVAVTAVTAVAAGSLASACRPAEPAVAPAAVDVPVAPVEPSARAAPVEPAARAASGSEPSATAAPLPSTGAAPSAERRCELGVWDEAAGACGIPPRGATGDPGGWAGCSLAKGPQNGRCFTGTHWASCQCACNGTTRWNDAKRRCE